MEIESDELSQRGVEFYGLCGKMKVKQSWIGAKCDLELQKRKLMQCLKEKGCLLQSELQWLKQSVLILIVMVFVMVSQMVSQTVLVLDCRRTNSKPERECS